MLGLALEGGGARGAFHMGAVKALMEAGYRFDGVAGTSVGALNGAIIAQGSFEEGYRMWEQLNNSLMFDFDDDLIRKILDKKLDHDSRITLNARIRNIIENRGLDTGKIRGVLSSIVDEAKMRGSPTELGIVTVSVPDFKPLELYKEDIPEGKLVEYLMASANYPAFRIEPIDGKFYIDGGFYDNCPANLLIRKGYRDIVMIRTFARGMTRKLEDDTVHVIRIAPSDDLGSILNFDHEQIMKNLKMGYFDAMRVIRGLRGRKYYLEPVCESAIIGALSSLPDAAAEKIARILQFPAMDPKRLLFEKIIPELTNIMKLPTQASYQDIVIGLMEHLAEENGLDRFKIRTFSDFLEELKSVGAGENQEDDRISQPTWEIKFRIRTRSMLQKDNILGEAAAEFLKTFDPRGF